MRMDFRADVAVPADLLATDTYSLLTSSEVVNCLELINPDCSVSPKYHCCCQGRRSQHSTPDWKLLIAEYFLIIREFQGVS